MRLSRLSVRDAGAGTKNRFPHVLGLQANRPFGNEGATSCGGQVDAHLLYSNSLAGGDPATPVFTAIAGLVERLLPERGTL